MKKLENVRLLSSEALPKELGDLIVLEDKKLYIISPWITNPKIPAPSVDWIDRKKMPLLDLLYNKKIESGTEIKIFTREITNDLSNYRDDFDLKILPDLHSKALIGSHYSYIGSANLTYSGLYLWSEVAFLVKNPTSPHDLKEFLLKEF